MCGLFGAASTSLVEQETSRVVQLGILSQLRGLDSTGMLSCYRENSQIKVNIMKDTIHSTDFFSKNEVRDFLDKKKPFIIAGHCRAATVGSISKENAHPFNLGKISGMKNGTVANVPGRLEGETDSQALLRLLQNEGVQRAAEEAKNGGYAMVWIDNRNQTLNFLRNSGRPLWLMECPGVVYWASEFEMLEFIRSRYNLSEKTSHIYLLEDEVHQMRAVSNPTLSKKEIKIEIPKKTVWYPQSLPFIPSKPTPGETIVMGPSPKPELGVPATLHKRREVRDAGSPALFQVKAYRNKNIKTGKLRHLLGNGCAFCSETLAIGEADRAYFFNNKQWLCEDCRDKPMAILNVGAHNKELYKCQIILGECHGSC